jgi:hypothetical protein
MKDIGPCHLDFRTTTFDDKNTSFQPTIVVTYISAFLVLNGHFIMFWTDIFYDLKGLSKAGRSTASEWAVVSTKLSLKKLLDWAPTLVPKAAQWLSVLLSACALFASKDRKTCFEPPKNVRWTDNWDDSLKTNIWPQQTIFRQQKSNFVCSKVQKCRWHGPMYILS